MALRLAMVRPTTRTDVDRSLLSPLSDKGQGNRLLQGLAASDLAALLQRSEQVRVRPGSLPDRLLDDGGACFPDSGLFSVLRGGPEDGVEAWLVGAEGYLDGRFLAPGRRRFSVVVQAEGDLLRVPGPAWTEWARHHAFSAILADHAWTVHLASADRIRAASSQSVQQRVAAWIVAACQRVGPRIAIRQSHIAACLHVRRASVTTALHMLEGERLLRSSRGLIVVLDPDKLRRSAEHEDEDMAALAEPPPRASAGAQPLDAQVLLAGPEAAERFGTGRTDGR